MILESAANTQPNTTDFPSEPIQTDEFRGLRYLLKSWTKSPTFTHTHYLATQDYPQAFDHLHLHIGTIRKHLIRLAIFDTSDGDDRDEIILTTPRGKKFRIRPYHN